jgi:hypothetical protein
MQVGRIRRFLSHQAKGILTLRIFSVPSVNSVRDKALSLVAAVAAL